MNSVDLDGNGTIDYNEFLAATMNRTKIMSKQNLEAAFKMFDKVNIFIFNLIYQDGSGKISVDEIMSIFNQTSAIEKAKFEEIINEADQNGDGEISLEEFKILMSKFF